ncbi:hypothetical protein HETIRDRAFT_54410 [Heterobasidion irregulare TC 32-1]|uniref:AB hydrolase-1 domain-containing protein n=1 Tax=Heterobasidion irregulare (strain TC 32-1) TaxID=747525 RepID=W4KB30_HETIT|nr:uncharacterized protein HETIRDRAFT_54410 [Heterobasidion irregulare TC 32-1]ETW82929.1 hypothetical protein HETIRDRAFT_54410 [Heterobasidion irregulare TC 32-1]
MSTPIVKNTYNVGGLLVHIYSKPNLLSVSGASKEIAALFLLHGRTGSADDPYIGGTAQSAFDWAEQHPGQQRDFIVIAFDHRNHGHRLVDALGNKGWKKDQKSEDHNERHAQVSSGTARDVSFLIDFLPSYLFPRDERTIVEWVVAGISLGGHSTWIALKNDPRVKIGIPVIGCPDYLALLASRAEHAGVTLAPPYVPASLLSIIRREDPAAVSIRASEASANPFLGKKILVLSGAADKLVPWVASKEFVEALHVGEGGRKQVVLEESAGHEYTDRMKAELVKFFWEEALVTDPKPAL